MLTEQERQHFITNGFLAKRGAVDPEACRRCVDVAWRELEKKSIARDPETWRSHPYLLPRKGVVKLRDEIAKYRELDELLAQNETIRETAKALIGDRTKNAGVRGLYPTFPVTRRRALPYEPHIEVHPVQIFVMLYLDDVEQDGGAVTAYPGSHRDVYWDFDSKFKYETRPSFQAHFRHHNFREPVQLTGGAGDAFFCHYRVLHCGSNNLGDRIRFGVLVDFARDDFEELARSAPGPDMWEDWSEAIQQSSAGGQANGTPIATRFSPSRALFLTAKHTARRLRGQPATEYSG